MARVRLYIGLLLVLGIILAILFVPVVPVKSNSFNFGMISANQQTFGSVSYVLFNCGEVHAYGSSSLNGNTYSSNDQYKWVC